MSIVILPILTTKRGTPSVREMLFTFDKERRKLICPEIGAIDIDRVGFPINRHVETAKGTRDLTFSYVGVSGKSYGVEIEQNRFNKFVSGLTQQTFKTQNA